MKLLPDFSMTASVALHVTACSGGSSNEHDTL